MALQKNRIAKGIEAGYWKITDCDVKKGIVVLGLFVNQEAAIDSDNFLCQETINIDFPVEVVNPLSFAYGKIKESRTREVEIGAESVEMNWFIDATDC